MVVVSVCPVEGEGEKVRVETLSVRADQMEHKTSDLWSVASQGHRAQSPAGGAQRKLLGVLQVWALRLDKPFDTGAKTKTKAKGFPVCVSHTGIFLVLTTSKLTPESQVEPQPPGREREGSSSF